MSGFSGVLSPGGAIGLPPAAAARSRRTEVLGDMVVGADLLPKFEADKALATAEGLLVCLDGVTLNSREILAAGAAGDLPTAVARRFKSRGASFPDELRGGFAGLVYDPSDRGGVLFTNHFGTKRLYYAREPASNGATYFSTSLLDVAECLRAAGDRPELDEVAAYYLLTFGYMLDDRTLIKGVSRLDAGCSLELRPGEAPRPHAYWRYANEQDSGMTEAAAARGLYEGLSAAVCSGFEKDLSAGYRHVSLLSGGLDSRMIAFFAKELGFRDVLTLTFGQSGCADEEIASAIARDLGYEHLFRPLDGGEFLRRGFGSCVAANDGLILYAGSAHALTSYEMIDWRRYGLLHNGNLADASQGDYVDSDEHSPPEASVWAYSRRLLDRVASETAAATARYPNQEAFAIATRGVNAILNGSISAQGLTETDEPFLHPDLVDFASRMPPRLKNGERAFLAMIERYFPAATRYPWQKWGQRPTLANLERRRSLPQKVLRRGRRLLQKGAAAARGRPDPADMNPFDHWARSSPEYRAFLGESRGLVEDFAARRGQLGVDALKLFDTGNPLEKSQAMTLAAAVARLELR